MKIGDCQSRDHCPSTHHENTSYQVYSKVPGLSENGSCKIFIADVPQRVTHGDCAYLMWTTPHMLL